VVVVLKTHHVVGAQRHERGERRVRASWAVPRRDDCAGGTEYTAVVGLASQERERDGWREMPTRQGWHGRPSLYPRTRGQRCTVGYSGGVSIREGERCM
jgi:hypothetical protein